MDGTRPWVIIAFEYMPRTACPAFWSYFESHYQLQPRLPGRISAVAVYKPK